MPDFPDIPPAAAVWVREPASTGKPVHQRWADFRRVVELDQVPADAVIHVCATHAYRLHVNGRFIAHGPSRAVPGLETFDTHDLSPHLRPGPNELRVTAWFCGSNNFQHAADPGPRFWATGRVGAHDLSTPGRWDGRVPAGRSAAVPAFSFAIGPVEHMDQRADDVRWESVVEVGPFAPTPRDLPMATGTIVRPTPVWSAPLDTTERRVGFVAQHPTAKSMVTDVPRDHAIRYATCLHTDTTRTVTLGLHWGPHFLNGVPLQPVDDPDRGNRQNVDVELRAGWNLLCGEVTQLNPAHPVMVGVPSDVVVRGEPSRASTSAVRFQAPRVIDAADAWKHAPPTTFDALPTDGWHDVPTDIPPPCPAWMMSWDQPTDTVDHDLPATCTEDRTWVFDFGTEFLGHVRIDLDTPPATIVDIAYDERRRGDGALNLFGSNPFVHAADRFVCVGGRQTIETFHPRGGRYLQVTLRDVGGGATLHGVSLRDARCLSEVVGVFGCGEAVFDWAWNIGRATLDASTEDVYCDSPWRERGLYLGDSYIQSLAHLCVSPDHRVIRRTLRLFAASALPDGQLPCVTPGWLLKPHADFSLIYALWLNDYFARTGDLGTVYTCLPAAVGVLESPSFCTSNHSPLWDASEANRLFIDWGVRKSARTFDENAVLNALRIAALESVATLRSALGADGADVAEEAARLRAVFAERLWSDTLGRFAPGTVDGVVVEEENLHANVLALAFDLATPTQRPALTEYVVDRLQKNADHAKRAVPHDDFCELYFLHFALRGLVSVGRFDVAERVIADHMGVMMEHDAPTLWECLHRGVVGQGSACHSWSATPMIYAQRYILGVREATAGEPDVLVVDPCTTLDRAEGIVPHPRGAVRVRWRRVGDALEIDATTPSGVTITHRRTSAWVGPGPSPASSPAAAASGRA